MYPFEHFNRLYVDIANKYLYIYIIQTPSSSLRYRHPTDFITKYFFFATFNRLKRAVTIAVSSPTRVTCDVFTQNPRYTARIYLYLNINCTYTHV